MHEVLTGHEAINVGSEKAFGFTFAGVFAFIALWSLWVSGSWWQWALPFALATLAVTLHRPEALRPLNQAWFKVGMLMAMVVNPLTMILIYVIAFIPTGIIMRAAGADPLRLKKASPEKTTYWLTREASPTPHSMENQF